MARINPPLTLFCLNAGNRVIPIDELLLDGYEEGGVSDQYLKPFSKNVNFIYYETGITNKFVKENTYYEYNASITYEKYATVAEGDNVYISKETNNSGNTPSSTPTKWFKTQPFTYSVRPLVNITSSTHTITEDEFNSQTIFVVNVPTHCTIKMPLITNLLTNREVRIMRQGTKPFDWINIVTDNSGTTINKYTDVVNFYYNGTLIIDDRTQDLDNKQSGDLINKANLIAYKHQNYEVTTDTTITTKQWNDNTTFNFKNNATLSLGSTIDLERYSLINSILDLLDWAASNIGITRDSDDNLIFIISNPTFTHLNFALVVNKKGVVINKKSFNDIAGNTDYITTDMIYDKDEQSIIFTSFDKSATHTPSSIITKYNIPSEIFVYSRATKYTNAVDFPAIGNVFSILTPNKILQAGTIDANTGLFYNVIDKDTQDIITSKKINYITSPYPVNFVRGVDFLGDGLYIYSQVSDTTFSILIIDYSTNTFFSEKILTSSNNVLHWGYSKTADGTYIWANDEDSNCKIYNISRNGSSILKQMKIEATINNLEVLSSGDIIVSGSIAGDSFIARILETFPTIDWSYKITHDTEAMSFRKMSINKDDNINLIVSIGAGDVGVMTISPSGNIVFDNTYTKTTVPLTGTITTDNISNGSSKVLDDTEYTDVQPTLALHDITDSTTYQTARQSAVVSANDGDSIKISVDDGVIASIYGYYDNEEFPKTITTSKQSDINYLNGRHITDNVSGTEDTDIAIKSDTGADDTAIITFPSTETRIYGTTGIIGNWIATQSGGATLYRVDRLVRGITKRMFKIDDNVSNGLAGLHSPVTKEVVDNIYWNGDVLSTVDLSVILNLGGVFYYSINTVDNPLGWAGQWRYLIFFGIGSNGELTITPEGEPTVTFDGVSALNYNEITIDIPKGLATAGVFVNGKDTNIPLAFKQTSTITDSRVVISSGTSSGTNRVFEFFSAGMTSYSGSSTKVLPLNIGDKKALEIFIPSGKRDYSIISPKSPIPITQTIGKTMRLVASNKYGIIKINDIDIENPNVLYNGLASLSIKNDKDVLDAKGTLNSLEPIPNIAFNVVDENRTTGEAGSLFASFTGIIITGFTAGQTYDFTLTQGVLDLERTKYPFSAPKESITSLIDVGNDVLVVNPVLLQPQSWTIIFSYRNKASNNAVGLFFILRDTSAGVEQRGLITLPQGSTDEDNVKISLPTQTTQSTIDNGLRVFIMSRTTDANLEVEITNIIRLTGAVSPL